MLIIVPPSESKRPPPDEGPPVALEQLSFPALAATRRRVLDALMATSARTDAFTRLLVGPSMADQVAANTWLLEIPTRPALEVYTGPLHQGLGAATLSPAATELASRELTVVSALWGALRPTDRIAPYRLHVCSHLAGLDRLEPMWRTVLPDVLADAAGPHGVVLDLRSPAYQAVGLPAEVGDRLVTLRVEQGNGRGRIGDVVAKRVRGQAARHLLESGAACEDPHDVASLLADHWPVHLTSPSRPGSPWTMTLLVRDTYAVSS